MARTVLSPSPATVAQQLSDLLQCFPAAAIGGVQWKTLLQKYEERHSTRLDLNALGHASPLAATTTLLWEVLRIVDSEDGDNPVVAVEDSVALATRIQRALRIEHANAHQLGMEMGTRTEAVQNEKDVFSAQAWECRLLAITLSGRVEVEVLKGCCATFFVSTARSMRTRSPVDPVDPEPDGDGLGRCAVNGTVRRRSLEEGQKAILVSQLKPLLQRNWHNTFDEASFGYLTEEGSSVKMRKMKHLLQAKFGRERMLEPALLRWRGQRLAWGGRSSRQMQDALEHELELVPSKRHNDLLLRLTPGPMTSGPVSVAMTPVPGCPNILPEDEAAEASPDWSSRASTGSTMSSAVHEVDELAALRAENEKLRSRNIALESTIRDQDCPYPVPISDWPRRIGIGAHGPGRKATVQCEALPENLFDNPFEPPPQVWHSASASPTASTVAHSGFGSEVGTPMGSGCVTPVQLAPAGVPAGCPAQIGWGYLSQWKTP
ncbi:Uncharacterized protein SCF082_LOCUS34643 [Durusdinium trenchii]|uniref:Uncharacterized protein n=1 Tax=Durusdinium trenchii TaxID=1381693 RepID=A0ABP0NZR1_9DINO